MQVPPDAGAGPGDGGAAVAAELIVTSEPSAAARMRAESSSCGGALCDPGCPPPNSVLRANQPAPRVTPMTFLPTVRHGARSKEVYSTRFE